MSLIGYSVHKLEAQFDSPFLNNFMDFKNKEVVDNLKGIVDKRVNPRYEKLAEKLDNLSDFLLLKQIGFGYKNGKDGVSCNMQLLVIKGLFELMSFQYPEKCDILFLSRVLKGEVIRRYIPTGKEGEALLNKLNENGSTLEKEEIVYYFNTISNMFVYEKSDEIVEIFGKQKFEKEDYDKINSFYEEPLVFKLSNEGISMLPEKLKKGFKEITLTFKSKANCILAISIMTSIYTKEDLYFYYDTNSKKVGIYDKLRLPIKGDSFAMIVNFSSMIKKVFGKDRFIKLRKEVEGKLLEENNRKKFSIASMTRDVHNRLLLINPDDIKLIIEGKFKNIDRIKEIENIIPYDEVFIKKVNGKKVVGKFYIKEDLKNYIKKNKL